MKKNAKKIKYQVNNKLHAFGETDFDNKKVMINKKKNKKQGSRGELINTIEHESLHVRKPKAKEKTIQRLAKKKLKKMGKKQKQRLYKRFD